MLPLCTGIFYPFQIFQGVLLSAVQSPAKYRLFRIYRVTVSGRCSFHFFPEADQI
ncbi:hypothetical protein D3C80_1522530 [compost metagenome]